jgi:Tfp pilus assembly major pilin PilA
MFGLIVFASVVLVLAAIAGPPYPQSWQSRWGNSDR